MNRETHRGTDTKTTKGIRLERAARKFAVVGTNPPARHLMFINLRVAKHIEYEEYHLHLQQMSASWPQFQRRHTFSRSTNTNKHAL